MPPRIHATDLAALTRCDRQVYLDYNGDRSLRLAPSDYQRWLIDQGRAFETQVAAQFPSSQPPYRFDNLEAGFQLTLSLMREGVERIYQGVLIAGDLVGIPDLLERVEGASLLGKWHYRPLDIKSASQPTEAHQLQVMAYMALLESLQGLRPTGALLLRPAADVAEPTLAVVHPVEFDAERYQAALAEVRRLAGGAQARPFLSSVCAECAWQNVCRPLIDEAQDISLIPGLRREVWQQLHERGVTTLTALAALSPADLLDLRGVGEKTAPSIIHHARALSTGEPIRLARPALPPGGLIYDIEALPDGLVYLHGLLVDLDTEPKFLNFLASSHAAEPSAFTTFLDALDGLPGPVYHYGSYEKTQLRALVARYGSSDRVDKLLARMVDLEKVLKDSAALPLTGYSLKRVARWLGFEWRGETQSGGDSILDYLAWLEDSDRAHLDRILTYNEDDCIATLRVLNWLREK
jgi:uncharacterized protein